MLNKLTVTQKGILLVLLPVAFELFFVFFLSTQLLQAQGEMKTILKERAAIVQLNQICVSMMRTVLQLFTPGRMNDQAMLDLMVSQKEHALSKRKSLAVQTNLSVEVNDVCNQFDQILVILSKCFDLAQTVITDPDIPSGRRNQHLNIFLLLEAFNANKKFARKIEAMEDQFQTRIPQQLQEIQNHVLLYITVGTATGLLLSFLLSRAFSQDITNRLKTISAEAQGIFQGKSFGQEVGGVDEIAQLEKTLRQSAAQHRQARLREQAILHNAADVICSLDSRFRFTGVSAVAERRWQRTEEDLIGAPLAQILTPDSVEPTLKALEEISRQGSGDFENKIALLDRTIAEFQWSVNWAKDEKRYFCTVHDVTELRAVERLKEQFLSIVSHDLRAPITSIGISIDLLSRGKRGDIPEKVVSVLKRADSSLSTLTVLVNELLDLSKLEAGKMTLNCALINTHDVFVKVRDSLLGLAESAGVKLEISEERCIIWADSLRLTQAITNLVSNAIKFSPRGGTVRINAQTLSEVVEIQIIDQGPGVPEADKPFVFEKFKQTSVQSNIAVKSTGLGLAIVRAIAEAHNGNAGLKDAPEKGSIFYIRLPKLSSSLEADA